MIAWLIFSNLKYIHAAKTAEGTIMYKIDKTGDDEVREGSDRSEGESEKVRE